MLPRRVDWDPDFATRSRYHHALAPFASALADERGFPSPERLTALAASMTSGGGSAPTPTFVRQVKPRRRGPRVVEVSERYDGHVALHGHVPTRPGSWHDLYNALVFIAFPRAKRALHARQFAAARAAIPEGAAMVPGRRTREQDHLTILDEGSLLVACAPGEEASVIARLRAEGEAALDDPELRAVAFGHALYEHFHLGRPPVRAMTVVLPIAALPERHDVRALFASFDEALEAELRREGTFMDPAGAFSTLLAG